MIINFLLRIDKAVLFFINGTLSNPFFDFLMPLFDKPAGWILPLLVLWIVLMIRDKPNRIKLAVLIPLIILLCDQTGTWLKHMDLRERPWFGLGPELIHHLGSAGGKHKSFPSNHAANISGVAFIFSTVYPRYKKYFWGGAVLIMFSRVYIGVHYPSDVLAGAVIGVGYGALLTIGWRQWEQRKAS